MKSSAVQVPAALSCSSAVPPAARPARLSAHTARAHAPRGGSGETPRRRHLPGLTCPSGRKLWTGFGPGTGPKLSSFAPALDRVPVQSFRALHPFLGAVPSRARRRQRRDDYAQGGEGRAARHHVPHGALLPAPTRSLGHARAGGRPRGRESGGGRAARRSARPRRGGQSKRKPVRWPPLEGTSEIIARFISWFCWALHAENQETQALKFGIKSV